MTPDNDDYSYSIRTHEIISGSKSIRPSELVPGLKLGPKFLSRSLDVSRNPWIFYVNNISSLSADYVFLLSAIYGTDRSLIRHICLVTPCPLYHQYVMLLSCSLFRDEQAYSYSPLLCVAASGMHAPCWQNCGLQMALYGKRTYIWWVAACLKQLSLSLWSVRRWPQLLTVGSHSTHSSTACMQLFHYPAVALHARKLLLMPFLATTRWNSRTCR